MPIKAALCCLFCDVRPGAFSESCIWYISNNDKTQKEKNMNLNAQIFQFYASWLELWKSWYILGSYVGIIQNKDKVADFGLWVSRKVFERKPCTLRVQQVHGMLLTLKWDVCSFDPGCCSHPSGHNIKHTIYLSRYINNRLFMSLI